MLSLACDATIVPAAAAVALHPFDVFFGSALVGRGWSFRDLPKTARPSLQCLTRSEVHGFS